MLKIKVISIINIDWIRCNIWNVSWITTADTVKYTICYWWIYSIVTLFFQEYIPDNCSQNGINWHFGWEIREKCKKDIKGLLRALDCSALYGPVRTSIIGVFLRKEKWNKSLRIKLAKYGDIQFWLRGQSIFDDQYKSSRILNKKRINHLLLLKASTPSNLQEMHRIIKEFELQVTYIFALFKYR